MSWPCRLPEHHREGRLRHAAAVAGADRHRRTRRAAAAGVAGAPPTGPGDRPARQLRRRARVALDRQGARAPRGRQAAGAARRAVLARQDRRRPAALGAVAGARQHRRRLRSHLAGRRRPLRRRAGGGRAQPAARRAGQPRPSRTSRSASTCAARPTRRRAASSSRCWRGACATWSGASAARSSCRPASSSSTNGSHLGMVPKIDLALTVPRIPCAKLLASIPAALTPKLQGFVLQGMFEAVVGAKIDFADLDALDLRGKVGIDGCKVKKAPETSPRWRGRVAGRQTSRCRSRPGRQARRDRDHPVRGRAPTTPTSSPTIRSRPHLINSIMTTEDNGFFKHRGWVTSEFKSALRRNLARGGFRLGASSITMQMVKNVLLSQGEDAVAQAAGAVPGLVPRAGAAQGADPRALLQRHRVRPAHLRHRAGGPALLRQEGRGADAARGGVLLVDPAQPQAALHPVLPRRAVTRRGRSTCTASWPRCTSAGGSPTTSTRRRRRRS